MPQFILTIDLPGLINAFTISSLLQRASNKMWSDGKTAGEIKDGFGNVVGHYEVRE